MTYSPLANPTETRAMLERFGLATKHRLGQNFLVDDNVIGRILGLAELCEESSVLEVGPGIGTLTLGVVLHAGHVTSIEADRELEPVLSDLSHEYPNFAFIMGDALKVSWDDICSTESDSGVAAEPNTFVSNLPYNVAATLILKFMAEQPSITREVVMVQAEVADRICAKPGSKTYGAYTAKLALYGEVTGRFEVPPTCFMPAPHVNSAVVRIDRKASQNPETGEALSAAQIEATCAVIDAAFAQRRKTIRNSMSATGFDKDALDAAFETTGIAPTARAEVLEPADFIRLSAVLNEAM